MTCPALTDATELPEAERGHLYATADGGVRRCVRCGHERPLVEVVT